MVLAGVIHLLMSEEVELARDMRCRARGVAIVEGDRREAQWAEREGGERGAANAVQAYVCRRACPKARISRDSRLFGFDGGTRPVMCGGSWLT